MISSPLGESIPNPVNSKCNAHGGMLTRNLVAWFIVPPANRSLELKTDAANAVNGETEEARAI